MAEILRLEHLEKSFGTHAVLRGVDLRVEKGEVLSVIGSSGSGKSTMLRCINLLETPPPEKSTLRVRTSPQRTWISAATVPAWAWCSSSSICSAT